MNREAIEQILPHRAPMLLLDEVVLEEDGTALGTYTIPEDAYFVRGHFPGNPIVPGVILCEIIAQTACVLLKDNLDNSLALYAGIDKVRFRGVVRPGDTLTLKARLLRSKLNLYVVSGEAYIDDRMCASGEFSFMLTAKP